MLVLFSVLCFAATAALAWATDVAVDAGLVALAFSTGAAAIVSGIAGLWLVALAIEKSTE